MSYPYKFKVFFKVDNINCEFIVGANGYDNVKERFFEELKTERLNGLFIESLDLKVANEVMKKIRTSQISREDISRTLKLND